MPNNRVPPSIMHIHAGSSVSQTEANETVLVEGFNDMLTASLTRARVRQSEG